MTVTDVASAAREGFLSAEHMKRYTTLGMATDQGKTGGVVGLGVLAELTGRGVAETGTTTFRPPFTPVPIAALGAGGAGEGLAPQRFPPAHDAITAMGARLQEADLRDVLANTLFKLNRFADAEEQLDKLIALQSNRADAYLNRGIVRETRAAWDLARADYGKYLELTNLKDDDAIVLEAKKRRLLCEERLAAEIERDENAVNRRP